MSPSDSSQISWPAGKAAQPAQTLPYTRQTGSLRLLVTVAPILRDRAMLPELHNREENEFLPSFFLTPRVPDLGFR